MDIDHSVVPPASISLVSDTSEDSNLCERVISRREEEIRDWGVRVSQRRKRDHE